MSHLLGLGHTRFAFIGGGFGEGRLLGDIGERRAAFLELMAAANLPVADGCVVRDREQAERRRDRIRVPDAPAGPAHRRRRLDRRPGRRRPSRRLAGWAWRFRATCRSWASTTAMAEYTNPALTTVRQPMAEMAAVAVGAAIDEAGGEDAPMVHMLVPSLVVRASSGPPPARPR